MIDFNKDFEKYLTAAYKRFAERAKNAEEAEELAADIFAEWADAPNDGLSGGVSPRAYFQSLNNPEELAGLFGEACLQQSGSCPLLLDRMAEVDGCAAHLFGVVLEKGAAPALKIAAAAFLNDLGVKPPVEAYARMLADSGTSPELADLCIEALCAYAPEAAPFLWELAETAREREKTYCAEVLLCAQRDERTYRLLADLFENGQNRPLYAWYLGKYGDERAAEILYKKLDTCNYAEYSEIKNAIERMGGCVEDTRDFSEDADYIKIKGANYYAEKKRR